MSGDVHDRLAVLAPRNRGLVGMASVVVDFAIALGDVSGAIPSKDVAGQHLSVDARLVRRHTRARQPFTCGDDELEERWMTHEQLQPRSHDGTTPRPNQHSTPCLEFVARNP